MSGTNRNKGLDLIRAVAILLVLIGHFELVGDSTWNYYFYKMGFYGVELFFVLSGFLIGGILLKEYDKGLSLRSITQFWKRRWLRTLPLFYLVYLFREIGFNPEHTIHYLHLFFLHTFLLPDNYNYLWFGETWSLVVEEWSYLLLPLSLIFLSKLGFQLKVIFRVLLGVLLFYIVIRYLYITKIIPSPDYNTETRIFAPLRLDSILYGVVLSMIKRYYNRVYSLIKRPWFFTLVGMSFVLLNFIPDILVYNYTGTKTIPASIGFSLVSLHLVLLLPYLEFSQLANKMLSIKPIGSLVLHTSLYSYCIYLIHEPIYDLLVYSKTPYDMIWFLRMGLSWIIIYIIGALSYHLFEQPILRWRDKNIPG